MAYAPPFSLYKPLINRGEYDFSMARKRNRRKNTRRRKYKKKYSRSKYTKKTTRIFHARRSQILDVGSTNANNQDNYCPAYTTHVSGQQITRLYFALSYLPSSTEYTNMFRYYKIKKVIVKIHPVATSSDIENIQGSENTTQEYSYCPVTDGVFPSGRDTMMQCSGYQSKLCTKGSRISLSPTVLNSIYGSTTTTHYTQYKSPWISTAYSSTPHWGLQILTDNRAVAGTYYFSFHRVEVQYFLALKGPK